LFSSSFFIAATPTLSRLSQYRLARFSLRVLPLFIQQLIDFGYQS
jgi:hypothetical protein